jgi:hypothetical protein
MANTDKLRAQQLSKFSGRECRWHGISTIDANIVMLLYNIVFNNQVVKFDFGVRGCC